MYNFIFSYFQYFILFSYDQYECLPHTELDIRCGRLPYRRLHPRHGNTKKSAVTRFRSHCDHRRHRLPSFGKLHVDGHNKACQQTALLYSRLCIRFKQKGLITAEKSFFQHITEVRIGFFRNHTAARRTIDKTDLQQIRIVNILQSHRFFPDAAGKRL